MSKVNVIGDIVMFNTYHYHLGSGIGAFTTYEESLPLPSASAGRRQAGTIGHLVGVS